MHALRNRLGILLVVVLSVSSIAKDCCAEEVPDDVQQQDLSRLIGTLRSRDIQKATAAVLEIARRGKDAEAAVPWLLESLADERKVHTRTSISDLAAYALAQIGTPSIAPLGKLIAEVDDGKLRDHALDALSQMEGHGQPVINALLKVGYHPDEDTRWRIVQMVAHIADDMEPPSPAAIDFLIKGMHHEQSGTRFQATQALLQIAPDPVLFLDEFLQRLHDSDVSVRVITLRGLGKIGPAADKCVPEVVRLLDDRTTFTQRFGPIGTVAGEACQTLAEMGDAANGALPQVRPLLHDDDAYLRCDAALAVVVLSEDREEAINVLILSTDSTMYSLGIARHAIQALARVGPLAARAMPEVKRALSHEDALIQGYAVEAASNIDPAEARPVLLGMAEDSDSSVRCSVIKAMGKYSAEDPEAFQVVVDGLTDEDFVVRFYSLACLKGWGQQAAPAIPVLKRLLEENPMHANAKDWRELLRELEGANE